MVVGAFGVGLIWTHRESGCLPDGICLFLRLGEMRKRPLVSPGVVITAAQAFRAMERIVREYYHSWDPTPPTCFRSSTR